MFGYVIAAVRGVSPRRHEMARLYEVRKRHTRWKEVPYGKKVQVNRRLNSADKTIGTVGEVLPESEHGITRHSGWVEQTPDFPGIRGVHVLVRFGKDKPVLMSLHELAPVV